MQIVSDFAAMQRRKCSPINRHNQHLFDHLGGAQQNRWGYSDTIRIDSGDDRREIASHPLSVHAAIFRVD
jgi:hypothetical protein